MYCCVVLCIFVLFYVFFVVLCIVCFVTFSVLFLCKCVLNYCHRVATQLQLNISYHVCLHQTRLQTFVWHFVLGLMKEFNNYELPLNITTYKSYWFYFGAVCCNFYKNKPFVFSSRIRLTLLSLDVYWGCLLDIVLWTVHRTAAFLTLRWLMSYIYGAPILDVSRSHTMTQHSR